MNWQKGNCNKCDITLTSKFDIFSDEQGKLNVDIVENNKDLKFNLIFTHVLLCYLYFIQFNRAYR